MNKEEGWAGGCGQRAGRIQIMSPHTYLQGSSMFTPFLTRTLECPVWDAGSNTFPLPQTAPKYSYLLNFTMFLLLNKICCAYWTQCIGPSNFVNWLALLTHQKSCGQGLKFTNTARARLFWWGGKMLQQVVWILPSHILPFQTVRLHAFGKISTNCHQFCLPGEERDLCYRVKRANVSRSGTSQNPQTPTPNQHQSQKHKSHVLKCEGETSGVCTE